MKKAALVLTACIVLTGMVCGYNINHSQSNDTTMPSEKMVAKAEQLEVEQDKKAKTVQRQNVNSVGADKTEVQSNTSIFEPYDLPAIKRGEKSQETIQFNLLLSQLDFNDDGIIDKKDFQLSEMSREVFAKKLVENGNVGTLEEAQWLIDGNISSSCGILY